MRSSPPSGRSWSATSTGAAAQTSGSLVGAWSRSAEPDTSSSVRSGLSSRATRRAMGACGSSSRPTTISAPRPPRAAPSVSVRFTAGPTPTVWRRHPAGRSRMISPTISDSNPISPSVIRTTCRCASARSGRSASVTPDCISVPPPASRLSSHPIACCRAAAVAFTGRAFHRFVWWAKPISSSWSISLSHR